MGAKEMRHMTGKAPEIYGNPVFLCPGCKRPITFRYLSDHLASFQDVALFCIHCHWDGELPIQMGRASEESNSE